MSITLSTSLAIEHQEKIADLPFVEYRAVGDTARTLRDELRTLNLPGPWR